MLYQYPHNMHQDGILSDDELNAFQIKCFSAPLQPEELSGVKAVVASKMRQVRLSSSPMGNETWVC